MFQGVSRGFKGFQGVSRGFKVKVTYLIQTDEKPVILKTMITQRLKNFTFPKFVPICTYITMSSTGRALGVKFFDNNHF